MQGLQSVKNFEFWTESLENGMFLSGEISHNEQIKLNCKEGESCNSLKVKVNYNMEKYQHCYDLAPKVVL